MEARKDILLFGVREIELDENEADEIFELENIDASDNLLACFENTLFTEVTNNLYSKNDSHYEFDSITDEKDKVIIEMTEDVKEWKA